MNKRDNDFCLSIIRELSVEAGQLYVRGLFIELSEKDKGELLSDSEWQIEFKRLNLFQ